MNDFFKNKVIWITGASSGIGEAMAKECNALQAKLVLSARRLNELERVKNECNYKSEEILLLPLDLEQHDNMKEKVDAVLKRFGRIDILFNNGGVSQRSTAIETSLEVDKRIMNINYFGTIALTKAVLPTMLSQKSGHIAVISSVTGKIGVPVRSAYAASKHALFGFFDTLRAELWRENIKVTMFCPGYIRTNVSINALKGNGTTQNTMDETTAKGMTPDVLSKKMLSAIQKNKEEVYIGGKEILGIYLRRFVPGLFSRIIRNRKE